jgi:hypothetical protein
MFSHPMSPRCVAGPQPEDEPEPARQQEEEHRFGRRLEQYGLLMYTAVVAHVVSRLLRKCARPAIVFYAT